MINANNNSVSADPHTVTTVLSQIKSEDDSVEDVPYREAVGSLMFLALVSRSDINYAVNLVSRYCNKHNKSHWLAIKRIMKYLTGTINYGILYESGGR